MLKYCRPMCLAIKCFRPTACSLDIYIILMSCQCYVTFDSALAFVFVLTFEHLSLGLGLGLVCQGLGLGLGLELLSLESKPEENWKYMLVTQYQISADIKNTNFSMHVFFYFRLGNQ